MDPLSKDPIVVTDSADFSDASTRANDEKMLIIRGDTSEDAQQHESDFRASLNPQPT